MARNANYDAQGLSITLSQRGKEIATIGGAVLEMARDLDMRGDDYHGWAHDHASEKLETYSKQLAKLADTLDRLRDYTNYPPVRVVPTKEVNVSTVYLPTTDTRGSRIRVKARATGKQLTVSYDYAANNPHESAIREMFPNVVTIEYTGDTSRGQEYILTIPE